MSRVFHCVTTPLNFLPCLTSPFCPVGVSYADFFWAVLTFAHLSFWAAAIFRRAAADIVFFLRIGMTFRFCPPFARTLAHRALWAAAILARAAADRRPRLRVLLPDVAPSNAASAVSSCSTVFAALSRSFFNCWTTPARLVMNPPGGIVSGMPLRGPILRRIGCRERFRSADAFQRRGKPL